MRRDKHRPVTTNPATIQETSQKFDTRTRTGTESTDEVSMGNHDTVKELGSLVQQAQLRAGVKSNRGSGNCFRITTHGCSLLTDGTPTTLARSQNTNSTAGCEEKMAFQITPGDTVHSAISTADVGDHPFSRARDWNPAAARFLRPQDLVTSA